MIGYHYTSIECYDDIRREGCLVPYLIDKPESSLIVKGIWLWPNDQVGCSNVGAVLFQMAKKSSTRIVKLRWSTTQPTC